MNVLLKNLTTTQANLIAMLFEDDTLTDAINDEINSRGMSAAVDNLISPDIEYSETGYQHVIVF